MSYIAAELEQPKYNAPGQMKPKNLIGGTRRRILKKAYNALQALIAQDNREALRAERYMYTPIFATGEPDSKDTKAVLQTVYRLNAMLLAKG